MNNLTLTSNDIRILIKYIYKRYGSQYKMMNPEDILNETILYMLEEGKELVPRYIAFSTFYAITNKIKQKNRLDRIKNSGQFFFHEKQREEMYSFYSYKKKKDPSAYPIYCITTKKSFKNVSEAARFYNTDQSNLNKCLNGSKNYPSAGKYNGITLQWKRLTYQNK